MAAHGDFKGFPPISLSPERRERNVRRSQRGSPNKPVRTGGHRQQTPLDDQQLRTPMSSEQSDGDAIGKTDPLITPSQGTTILTGNAYLTQQRPPNPQQTYQTMADVEEKAQDSSPAEPVAMPDVPPEERKEDRMEQEEESKQEDQVRVERAHECKYDDGDQGEPNAQSAFGELQEFHSFEHLAIMDQYEQTTRTIVLYAPVFAGQDHEVVIHIVVPADAAMHKDLKPGATVAVTPQPELGDLRESTPIRLPFSALRLLGSDGEVTPEEELEQIRQRTCNRYGIPGDPTFGPCRGMITNTNAGPVMKIKYTPRTGADKSLSMVVSYKNQSKPKYSESAVPHHCLSLHMLPYAASSAPLSHAEVAGPRRSLLPAPPRISHLRREMREEPILQTEETALPLGYLLEFAEQALGSCPVLILSFPHLAKVGGTTPHHPWLVPVSNPALAGQGELGFLDALVRHQISYAQENFPSSHAYHEAARRLLAAHESDCSHLKVIIFDPNSPVDLWAARLPTQIGLGHRAVICSLSPHPVQETPEADAHCLAMSASALALSHPSLGRIFRFLHRVCVMSGIPSHSDANPTTMYSLHAHQFDMSTPRHPSKCPEVAAFVGSTSTSPAKVITYDHLNPPIPSDHASSTFSIAYHRADRPKIDNLLQAATKTGGILCHDTVSHPTAYAHELTSFTLLSTDPALQAHIDKLLGESWFLTPQAFYSSNNFHVRLNISHQSIKGRPQPAMIRDLLASVKPEGIMITANSTVLINSSLTQPEFMAKLKEVNRAHTPLRNDNRRSDANYPPLIALAHNGELQYVEGSVRPRSPQGQGSRAREMTRYFTLKDEVGAMVCFPTIKPAIATEDTMSILASIGFPQQFLAQARWGLRRNPVTSPKPSGLLPYCLYVLLPTEAAVTLTSQTSSQLPILNIKPSEVELHSPFLSKNAPPQARPAGQPPTPVQSPRVQRSPPKQATSSSSSSSSHPHPSSSSTSTAIPLSTVTTAHAPQVWQTATAKKSVRPQTDSDQQSTARRLDFENSNQYTHLSEDDSSDSSSQGDEERKEEEVETPPAKSARSGKRRSKRKKDTAAAEQAQQEELAYQEAAEAKAKALKAASSAKASAEAESAPIQQSILDHFSTKVLPALLKADDEDKQCDRKVAGQGLSGSGSSVSSRGLRRRSRSRSRSRDRNDRRNRSRSRDKWPEGGRPQRDRTAVDADGGRDASPMEFNVNEADDQRGQGPPSKSGDTAMAPAPVPATKRKEATIPTKAMSPAKTPATKKMAVPSPSN